MRSEGTLRVVGFDAPATIMASSDSLFGANDTPEFEALAGGSRHYLPESPPRGLDTVWSDGTNEYVVRVKHGQSTFRPFIRSHGAPVARSKPAEDDSDADVPTESTPKGKSKKSWTKSDEFKLAEAITKDALKSIVKHGLTGLSAGQLARIPFSGMADFLGKGMMAFFTGALSDGLGLSADADDSLGRHAAAQLALPAAFSAPGFWKQVVTGIDPASLVPLALTTCGRHSVRVEGAGTFAARFGDLANDAHEGDVSYSASTAPNVLITGQPVMTKHGEVTDHDKLLCRPPIHLASSVFHAPPAVPTRDGAPLVAGQAYGGNDQSSAPGHTKLLQGMSDAEFFETFNKMLDDLGFNRSKLAVAFDLNTRGGLMALYQALHASNVWQDGHAIPGLSQFWRDFTGLTGDGFSASMDEYLSMGGRLSPLMTVLLNNPFIQFGTPSSPGAGTGGLGFLAPDRVLGFSIRQLLIEHDALFGTSNSLLDVEAQAWLNALRQNPNPVGFVYATIAVSLTTLAGALNGFYTADSLNPFTSPSDPRSRDPLPPTVRP
jgi:hypothetical protein